MGHIEGAKVFEKNLTALEASNPGQMTFDTRNVVKGLLSWVHRVESTKFIYKINNMRFEVRSDQHFFTFDPRDANNSLQWRFVQNQTFTQNSSKCA